MRSLPQEKAKRVIIVAGPTATGKSEAALAIARALNGEVVSIDSMQVYRGMDIGTAKPSAAERAQAPHHMLDVAEVREPFDVAQFCQFSTTIIHDILEQGRTPILCGGTGLYFKALLEGLDELPSADADLRRELNAKSPDELRRELAALDPAALAQVDIANPRRVLRAIEIVRLTGKPLAFSRKGVGISGAALGPQPLWFGITRDPGALRERIETRVEKMFAAGLVEETRRLLQSGLASNPNALQAIGYKQVIEHLSGALSLRETVQRVKARTWQYAKRQLTWFKFQMRLEWHDLGCIPVNELVDKASHHCQNTRGKLEKEK